MALRRVIAARNVLARPCELGRAVFILDDTLLDVARSVPCVASARTALKLTIDRGALFLHVDPCVAELLLSF